MPAVAEACSDDYVVSLDLDPHVVALGDQPGGEVGVGIERYGERSRPDGGDDRRVHSA
jgi:hypothetical protein